MEKNFQNVDVKSMSKEQRAALLAQLQQEEKDDRIARRETYEALRGAFMHEVKARVTGLVAEVRGFRDWVEEEVEAFFAKERPDYVFLAYVSWEQAIARIRSRPAETDRYLDEALLRKVSEEFLKMSEREKFVVLDTSGDEEKAFAVVKAALYKGGVR